MFFEAQKKDYQICNFCIMDTSDPEIHFNEVGRCNHCADKDPLDPEISRARYQTLGDPIKGFSLQD